MNADLLNIRMPLWNKKTLHIQGRILAIVLLFTILVTPVLLKPEQIPLPTCYFKRLTGHSCPTCGLTHAFYDTAHFQFKSAFQHHMFGPIIYFILFMVLLKLLFETITGNYIRIRISSRLRKTLILIGIIGWLGYWLVRFIQEIP